LLQSSSDINDQATSAWLDNNIATAQSLWEQLPESAVRQFNLGLCAIVGNDLTSAKSHFQLASQALPLASSWHHYAGFLAVWCEEPALV
jgi:hypothetical protein